MCDGCEVEDVDDESWEIPCIVKVLASTIGWKSYNTACAVGNNPSGNNATGFSAVTAGDIYPNSFGGDASFWSATQDDNISAYGYYLLDFGNEVTRDSSCPKFDGYSVRCVRNNN